jgi:hypothetical protein
VAHFKCVSCRSRVWRDGDAADHPLDLCPGCGGPLQHVSDPGQLMGLRALRTRPRRRQPGFPAAPRIGDRIREPSPDPNDASGSARANAAVTLLW